MAHKREVLEHYTIREYFQDRFTSAWLQARFFEARGLTWESFKALPPDQQRTTNAEFVAWCGNWPHDLNTPPRP